MRVQVNKESPVIADMFNNIAGRYDFLNRLLSFGIDKRWRRVLIKELMKKRPANALDIACGTGDIAISLYKKGVAVTGVDIAEKMIEIAELKSDRVKKRNFGNDSISVQKPHFIHASADKLPIQNNLYDCVTIGFGIRNFEKRGESLLEIKRVLKNSGSLYILEFATPGNYLWRSVYNFYFKSVLPAIGRVLSGQQHAYNYLPASVDTFPQYNDFTAELEQIGFKNVKYKSLTGGVVILYTATNC